MRTILHIYVSLQQSWILACSHFGKTSTGEVKTKGSKQKLLLCRKHCSTCRFLDSVLGHHCRSCKWCQLCHATNKGEWFWVGVRLLEVVVKKGPGLWHHASTPGGTTKLLQVQDVDHRHPSSGPGYEGINSFHMYCQQICLLP